MRKFQNWLATKLIQSHCKPKSKWSRIKNLWRRKAKSRIKIRAKFCKIFLNIILWCTFALLSAIYSFIRFGNRPAHPDTHAPIPRKPRKPSLAHPMHTRPPSNTKPQKQSDSDRHQKPKSSFQVSFSTGARKGPSSIQRIPIVNLL